MRVTPDPVWNYLFTDSPSTDYSITEVAQLSGFSSQSYFAQCFQKYCRMTASAYRKSCRENVEKDF